MMSTGGSQTDTESALPPQDEPGAVATSVMRITQTSRGTVRAKTLAVLTTRSTTARGRGSLSLFSTQT